MAFDVKNTTTISILDLVAPFTCRGCSALGEPLCERCKKDNIQVCAEVCPRCRKNRKKCRCEVSVFAVAWRDGLMKDLVEDYKYQAIRRLAKTLVEMLDEILPKELSKVSVVPLPTIGRHIRERGFDHTKLLAKELVKRRKGWEVCKVIYREDKAVQVGSDVGTRKRQAKAAYKLSEKINTEKKYLLLDDVWTTGASMESAISLMQKAGCKDLVAAVLAISR